MLRFGKMFPGILAGVFLWCICLVRGDVSDIVTPLGTCLRVTAASVNVRDAREYSYKTRFQGGLNFCCAVYEGRMVVMT